MQTVRLQKKGLRAQRSAAGSDGRQRGGAGGGGGGGGGGRAGGGGARAGGGRAARGGGRARAGALGHARVAAQAPGRAPLPRRRALPAALPAHQEVQRPAGAGHAGALPRHPTDAPALVPPPRPRRPRAGRGHRLRVPGAAARERRLWPPGDPVVRRALRPVQVHVCAHGARARAGGGAADGRRGEPGARLRLRQRRVGADGGPPLALVAGRHPRHAALHPELDAHAPQGHALPERAAAGVEGLRVLHRPALGEAARAHTAARQRGGAAGGREPAHPAQGVRRRGAAGGHDRAAQGAAARQAGAAARARRHGDRPELQGGARLRHGGRAVRRGRQLPQAGGGLRPPPPPSARTHARTPSQRGPLARRRERRASATVAHSAPAAPFETTSGFLCSRHSLAIAQLSFLNRHHTHAKCG